MRYPFNNPTKGGLAWSGQGRACNRINGWFVIDSVVRVAGQLSLVDMRFEQHCNGRTDALRGAMHWTR
jgi:hypothetical protein